MGSPTTLTDYWAGIASTAYGLRQGLGLGWCVAMTGDSRAEASPIQVLGGGPCYSIGMPGIAINEGVTWIPPAVKNLGPRVLVIQLGVNLTWIPLNDPQWETVVSDTKALLKACRDWSPHLVLTTPVPMEKGFPTKQSDADCVQRCGWLDTISFQMAEAADTFGATVVDLHGLFRGSDGTALPGTTWDGTHFTAATYGTIKGMLDPVVGALFPT